MVDTCVAHNHVDFSTYIYVYIYIYIYVYMSCNDNVWQALCSTPCVLARRTAPFVPVRGHFGRYGGTVRSES